MAASNSGLRGPGPARKILCGKGRSSWGVVAKASASSSVANVPSHVERSHAPPSRHLTWNSCAPLEAISQPFTVLMYVTTYGTFHHARERGDRSSFGVLSKFPGSTGFMAMSLITSWHLNRNFFSDGPRRVIVFRRWGSGGFIGGFCMMSKNTTSCRLSG